MGSRIYMENKTVHTVVASSPPFGGAARSPPSFLLFLSAHISIMAEIGRPELPPGGPPSNPVPKARPPPPPPNGPPHRRAPARPTFFVDREKVCPLLIRVFTKTGEHHTREDYAQRGKVPKDEVQIYTWMDATLRELTDLVKEVAPEARRRDARLSFAFVYPDRRGHNTIRNVGITHANGIRRGGDDHLTLFDLKFQTGDFLDVAIL